MTEHEDAQCTANTRVADSKKETRCIRELGHCGLHRYYNKGYVVEFPDAGAWFPHYQEGELAEEPNTSGW